MSDNPTTTDSAQGESAAADAALDKGEDSALAQRDEAKTRPGSEESKTDDKESGEAKARAKSKKAKLKAKRRKKKRKSDEDSVSESQIDTVDGPPSKTRPAPEAKKPAKDEDEGAKDEPAPAKATKAEKARDSEDQESAPTKKPAASKEPKAAKARSDSPPKTRKRKKPKADKAAEAPASKESPTEAKTVAEAVDEASSPGLESEALGELTASEQSLTKSEIRKKRRRKKKKRLRKKKKPRIAVDTAELNDTKPRLAEDGDAIDGIDITLEPPALAKKIAEERRARGLNALDESTKSKSDPDIEVVADAEAVHEVAPEPKRKTAKVKGKKAKTADEDSDIEVLEETSAKARRSRKLDKKTAKKVDDDDDGVIEVVGGPVDEDGDGASKAARAKKTKRGRKVDDDDGVIEVVGAPAEDVDDDDVEVVEEKTRRGSARTRSLKKGTKSEAASAKRSPAGKRKATRREKRPTVRERRARDGEAQTKKTPIVPIAIGAGALVLVGAAIALSSGGSGDNEAARKLFLARRDEQVSEAIQGSEDKTGERFAKAAERLQVLARVYKDAGVRRKLSQALEDLRARQREAATDALDEALLEAQSALDSKDPKRALLALDGFPRAFRDLNEWRERGRQKLDEVLVLLRAEEEGRPLLKRAEELRDKGEDARALGVLAAFSRDHKDSAVGKEIEKLRNRIEFIRAKRADNAERRAAAQRRAAGVLAQREAEEKRLRKLLEKESSGNWRRQTGSTLFTWQISNTQPIKRDQIWTLEGKTLTGRNSSGRTRFLARSQRTWRSYIVRFEVRLEAGSWGFMAHTDRVITPTRQQLLSFDQLEPTQTRGEWVAMKIYVLGNQYYEVVNDGERRPLNPTDRQRPKESGGFGFVLPANARASFRNIEALVLERSKP